MKCPRCHKHRIRYKDSGLVKYCKGCGWQKSVEPVCSQENTGQQAGTTVAEQSLAEFDAEQKRRAEEHKDVLGAVVEQQNPPAVSEWIGQVTKDLSNMTGIPAEILMPKEPSKVDEPKEPPKKGIVGKFMGLFRSSPQSTCSTCHGTGKVENRSAVNCKIPDTCWANTGSCKNCEWNGGGDSEEVCPSCGGTGK